uniref:TipJ family phage tail tip protein n=1 Tax=Pasteurella multocida TaxID=747 RepID=UPI00403DB00A
MGGRKGGGGHTPYEAPESGQSKQFVSIVEIVSEGQIKGLVDGVKSVYLDNTPLQASDDSFNFKNVEAQGRIGTQDQEEMEGFNTSEKEIAVSTQVKKLTPITRTITDRKVSRLRLTLGVQSLFHQNDKGDVYGSKVDFTVTIGERSHLVSISGKYSSQYLKQVEFGDLPPVPFQVKVERVNADSKSQRLQNNTIWASYTEIIETQFAYPNTAILGIRFDSEYFSSIPNRTYEIYGIEMKVPSNYDPFERTYTGFWDGTFKIAWTNNPAWILYDLMTNKRYGLGWRLGEFNVDKWALYQAAQYCDQMVPDGFGGQEPRFTCNAWLTDQRKAYDVINDICSIFRAMPVWNGREFTVVMDRPADPVWTYTNANVISGEFSYQYSAQKARHNEIHIEYIDADDSYERKIEVVSDDDLIRRHGLNVKKVTAFACTSRGQAFRTGKWILETERLETKTVTFAVGAEGLMHIPGDIIRVADCDYADTNIGGRVLDINGNKVTLDREIEINGNSHLTYIDGEAKHKDIRIVSKNGKEVMLESEPVGLAELGVWSLTTQEINVQLFRALTINEEEQGQYTIVALQHEPQKEAIVDNGAVFEPRETTLSTAGLDKVSHVNVQANGDGVALSFDYVVKHSAMVKYQIKLYKAGTFYKIYDDLTSPNYKFTGLPDGEYTAEIRAKNEQGQLSEAVTKSFNISFAVSELTTVSKVFGILLQWKNPVFANPNSAIEIWTSTDNQFENARKLVSLSYPTSEYLFSGLGVNEKHYFWVRMIDTANGNAGEFTKSVVGTSEKSGKKLAEYIQGQVTKSTLAKDLAQEITQIQATASEATDSAKMALSRIDSEATTRAEQIKQEGESIKVSVRKEYEKNASAISNLEKTTQDHALQISTVHSKFNQLEIGGRNLLKHSEKLNKNWGKNSGVTLDTDHGIATLTANGRLVALSQVLIEDQVEVKDGKVVLSFDALSNKSGKLNLRLRRYTGSTYSDISAYVTVDSRDYKRYSVVFDYQKSEGQTRLSVEIVTYEKDGTVFNIKKPKLELGNIATDWTPAPEDVDVAISEVSADIIQHKQSQATVNKSTADKLDSLTDRVGLSESEIQLIQKTASEKDKSFSTKLETLDSKVAQNTSGISDLKETKASKDEVASLARKELKSEWTDEVNATKLDLTSKITALEQTVSNENKSLAVKSETLEAKFNQLQIGGRNLLKHSEKLNKNWGKNGGVTLDTDHGIATLTANGRLVALSQVLIEDQVEVKDGKVVLSFDALSNKSGKLNLRLRRYTGSTYSDISAYVTVDSRDYKRYSVVFDYQKSEGQTRLSVEIVTYEKDGTVFNIKKPKLELGNIATDWTPAPEDVDVAISEVSADIIQHKQSQATVNKSTADKLDSLTARVGLSESEIQLIQKTASEKDKSFSTKLETLDSKVAQNTSGISDLKETKASKDEVASLARKELKSEWTDEVNATKLDLTSKITALEQTVSNENKSLAVKSETLEAKFNQLQIGGRNLLKHSEKLNKNWGKNGGVTLDTDHGIATLTANGRLVALSQVLIEDQVEVKDGKVVLSFDALSNKSGKLNLRLRRYTGSTYSDISAYVTVDSRDYKRYSVVFDYQKSEGQTRLSVEIVTYEKDGTVFNIKKPKLELGNIATDWTPAPEDVDVAISEVSADIIQHKQSQATVNKSTADKLDSLTARVGLSESEIQLIQKTASEKDKSFSTKLETLDSKVAQNTSGISDLKETKASKDEVASLARKELKSEWTDEVNATKLDLTSKITALEQTVSNENKSLAVKSETLEAKFNQLQIGGRNLLKHSEKLNKNWGKNSGVTLDTDHGIATLTANGRLVALSQVLIEDQVEVKDGKVVLSFDALSNKSGKLNLRLRRYTGSTYSDISAYVTVDSRDYKRYSVVFDYQKSEGQTRLSVEIVTYEKDGTVFNIKKPKLELGNIATDWTPAPEDVDSTLSEVNASISSLKNTTAEKEKAFSQEVSTVKAEIVGAKALITSSSQAISSLDGKVQSMYTLKTETVAGGRKAIAGIALGADGQTAESQVIIFANKFAIADPNSNALKTPFVISTHNGRSQVALAGDLIVDDSITGNKIQANSTITAPNINGGSFTGGSIDIGNGNFTVDSTGNLTAKNGVFSGRLDGATGRFKGELEVTKLIGGGVIEQIVATMTKTGTRSVRYVYYVNQRDHERARYGTVYVPIYAATIRIDPYPVDRYIKIGDELSFVLKANQAFTKKYERVGTFFQDNEYVAPVDPDKNLLIISYALSDTGTISFS